ncbi:ABC transporter permease [Oceanobacillus oncorhynchi]|uniref:ABC transporter permease n=1 Tax=Oceanobacillus oncorhynchi TaxID=545501 RepID=UPI001867E30E|nr:ABC transporter permease [Oceanobacillus oncorhynchi]
MRKKAAITSIMVGLLLFVVWEYSARRVSDLILPQPADVFTVLMEGFIDGYFYPHIMTTLTEIFIGLLIGTVLGIGAGIIIGESAFLRNVFSPYIVISQAIPKIALAPLFMLWFGYGMTSKVVITALVCFFPLLEATASAMRQVNNEQLALFKLMHASRLQTLWHLKIPGGLPSILQGLRVAVILALVGAIVGEFIGANQGLGALITASQSMMDTTLMFAVLIILALIGFLLYGLVNLLEWKLLHLKKGEEKH